MELLEQVKTRVTDDEFRQLQQLVHQNVMVLGEDQCFAIRDKSGQVKAFKQRVRLSKESGTLVKIKDTWSVSAQGYEVLAEAAGAAVMTPKYLHVDNQRRSNPFVQRDEHYRVVTVYARAVAFRFSNKGLPVVSDWMTTYDSPNYRLIDLLAKAKDEPKVFRLLPKNMEPEHEFQQGKPVVRTWARYYFDPACDLWVDTSSPQVLDWHSQIIHREKKSLDYAQTFSRRNALKHLLGIQKAPEGCKGVWDVTVMCWRPIEGSIVKWDMTRYVEVRNRVEHLSSGGSFELAEVSRGSEEISPDIDDSDDAIDVEADAHTTETVAPAVENGPAEASGEAAAPAPAETEKIHTPRSITGDGDGWDEHTREKAPAPGKKRKSAESGSRLSDEILGKIANLRGFQTIYPEAWRAALKACDLPATFSLSSEAIAASQPAVAIIDKLLDALSRIFRELDRTEGGSDDR